MHAGVHYYAPRGRCGYASGNWYGVEFLQKTEDEQAKSPEFLEGLRASRRGAAILVEPEEVDLSPASLTDAAKLDSDPCSPCSFAETVFLQKEFLNELRPSEEA